MTRKISESEIERGTYDYVKSDAKKSAQQPYNYPIIYFMAHP